MKRKMQDAWFYLTLKLLNLLQLEACQVKYLLDCVLVLMKETAVGTIALPTIK